MRKFFMHFFFCTALLVSIFSCEGKRPENGVLEFSFTVKTIQKNASVEVWSGETAVLSGKTDDTGEIRFESVQNIGDFKVRVCGGTVDLVSSDEAVAWNGCMEKSVRIAEDAGATAVVDFLSTFIEKYSSETSQSEWFNYLDISGDVFPELQTSLTDATKRYLWHQAFARIAESVSKANGTAPETQFSTENLLNMLYDDLTDDNIINGSTYVKFGSAPVSAAFMKGLLAGFLSEVSEKFSASELEEWSEKIRTAEAGFLGGEDAEKSGISIEITAYPEGNKGVEPEYFSGAVTVEAKAEPENMIVSLNCFADNEILADKDEKAAYFQGGFVPDESDGEREVAIRCEASNGITVKSVEKTIALNNEAPLISAVFYGHGTLNPVGTENSQAAGSIDVKAEATHKRYAVEELVCSIDGYQTVDTSDVNYQYKAVVDTEELPDGKNILECEASVNQKKYKAAFPFYTKNTIIMKVKPYITNKLYDFDSVSVSCGGGIVGRTSDSAPVSGDEIKVKSGAVCIVTVSGGSYEPVISESAETARRFNGSLSAVFVPSAEEDIVVTPLTTIGSYIFLSRRNPENIADKELLNLVSEHLSQHLSHSFDWKDEPANTSAADNKTKYYILLSGLEYLPYLMETNMDSGHGIYTVSNVLGLLQEDYKDTVFDGKNGEDLLFFGEDDKKTAIDSNFFRYYYALAVKRFLSSAFNKTGFTQMGTVVGNIASNSDQFLFPAESGPIPIDSAGPEINSFVFSDLFEAENEELSDIAGDLGIYAKGDEQVYDLTNGIMPHFAKAFLLKFTVTPQDGTFADLNSVTLKSKDPDFVFRIKRIEPQSIENSGFSGQSTEFTMLAEYFDEENIAMEKQIPFSVSAQDIAYNSSETEITVFLDNKKPVLSLNTPEGTVRAEDVEISWNVSDSRIENIRLTVSKWDDEETVVFEEESESCSPGECSLSANEFAQALAEAGLSGSEADGLYKVALSAVDHSGNRSTVYGSFIIDTTPPEIPRVRVESDGKVIVKDSVTNKNYFTLSLINPDMDIDKWAARVSCGIAGGNVSQEKTGGYVPAHESLDFFNLFTSESDYDVVACTGFVSVCDRVGNCANKDFTEPSGEVFIDSRPPHFISYDKEKSIFTECVDSTSSFVITFCTNMPNCNSGGMTILGKKKPQLLLTYADNMSSPENIRLFIQSAENGWVKSCQYIANQSADESNDCNKFYCNLEGSSNGQNNFVLTAYDEVGNHSERFLSVNMDFTPVEPLKVNLMYDFFTSERNNYVWWDEKEGVEYTCTITKRGDSASSADCSNGGNIKPSMLSGTGYYTVSVESKSASTKRTDVVEFKFFDLSDLSFSVTPQRGQFLHSGELFKVGITADSGGMAEISKVELYLYSRYMNGVLQDSTERLVITKNYSSPVASLNNIFSGALSVENTGQFRNMKAVLTFADGTKTTKRFKKSSANAFLYCLMESDETVNDASLTFRNKALDISFEAPKCLAADDYKMVLNAYYPSVCDNLNVIEYPISVTKNYANNFTVKGDFVFFKNENHTHDFDCAGTDCSEVVHSCAAETHNFSSGTNLKIIYNCGSSFVVNSDSSVQCEHSESEIVFYGEDGDYDEYDNKECKKCRNKLSSSASCFSGKHKTMVLNN